MWGRLIGFFGIVKYGKLSCHFMLSCSEPLSWYLNVRISFVMEATSSVSGKRKILCNVSKYLCLYCTPPFVVSCLNFFILKKEDKKENCSTVAACTIQNFKNYFVKLIEEFSYDRYS